MKFRAVGSELLEGMVMIMVAFRIFDIALIRTNTNKNTHRHYTQVSLSYLYIRNYLKL
jgi:hypothetical protein